MTLFRQDSGSDRGRKREGRRTPTPRRQPPPTPPARPFRTLAFWVLVVLLSLVAYRMYQGNFMTAPRVEISYTRFIHEVDRGNIASLQILEKTVSGELRAETPLRIAGHDVRIKGFKTNILGNGSELPDRVWKTNPGIDIEVKSAGTNWLSLMFTMLPFLLLVPLWLLFWRNMQSGGSAALKFGKTKAKVLIETTPKVTFKDVAGCDEAKQELHEIIEFLKEPQKFQRLGGRIPKGALLLGPPGSGKTLLAKAVAGEAGVPFFSMSGSDFVEMFVGVGASVTGDTPVLVRRNGETKLLPIGELVDGYFDGGAEGFLVPVADVETLGFVEKESKFKGSPKTFLGSSAWSRVRGVLRHHVSEIYEIHYLGGVLRTTGDHSVFVRTRNGIHSVPASALKAGDVLVNLPFRVRGEYSATRGTPHSVRGHQFPEIPAANRLPVFEGDEASERRYEYAMAQRDHMSQAAIASAIGVSQATVGNWQAGKHAPRSLSTAYVDVSLPEQVEITPELLKLFGFYVAEGRENGCLEFTFGSHETDLHREVIESTRRIFGVIPKVTPTSDNSTKITFHSAPLGRFFARHCGTGSHEKRVPGILWDLPRAHFDAFLTGYALGDGYVTQEGKLSMVSVSHQLIRELTWLCAMHGIKAGVRKVVSPGGRILKNRPLPETVAWNLIIGKTSHNVVKDRTNQGKRPIVRSVIKKPYDGFVYDLCGCDNEAFFGGEKPVLLHNSRVRDLFEQAKRNAPCLTGDTMVTLLGGRQISIAEMYEKRMVGARVLAMKDEDLSIHDAAVIGITKKPTNEVFEITTSTSSIRATGNHLFPVKRGGLKWVRADELSTDDHIAAPESVLNDSEQSQYVEFVNGRETLVDERRVIADASAESWGGDSRASATSILEPIESAVCWTRIQSIERTASSEFVYDLCLDRYHNFVANRLFTHNCIVFVDEIDAVGRHRGAGLGGGHDEREQTLNQLLVEMDGFESNEGVIMIAATNRPDVLDPALLRPGRFDRQIVVDWPDVRGREGIFRVHTRNIPLDDDVELQQLARGTPGLAGADIANMVNEAALLAARRNRKKVVMQDFEDAKDKVMLGMERRSLVMTDEERKSTAFHEAGHALVAWLTPGSEPVDKVTIIPRGRALGITSYLPREERHSRSKEDLERWLAGAMGGRAAEQLVFGHLTTGASSDLENSTALARRMVCELGMSDNLGPLTFGKKEEMVFLGREISSHKDYSESTAVLIDQEVRNIIERAYSKAESLLRDNMDKLTLLANTLLEREVLDGDEMDRVLRGETLPPIKPVDYEKPPETPLAEPAAAKAGEMPTVEPFSPPAPRPAGA